MRQFKQCIVILLVALGLSWSPAAVAAAAPEVDSTAVTAAVQEEAKDVVEKEGVDVKEIVFEHLGNSYEWHIAMVGSLDLRLPLPVILYSENSGWHVFSSERLRENNGSYQGFYIAPEESIYAGRLVEAGPNGEEIRPWDFSLTKVALALIFNSLIVIVLILCTSRWYRKPKNEKAAPGGFVGFMEMFIMMVNDDIIKPCVGPKYRKFSPYLLTAFFFIFITNLMSLVPFFPGGVNVTGNITITFFLALCTFLMVNIFGTKTYWKDIFWPDVPWWLKAPIPMMPMIELLGIFTKPFALMIRLFANMLAGHMAMLVLTCLIFITASMGAAINAPITVASVLFNIFMNMLEVLVAFIQAYVFTMLSAVFIGLAMEEHVEKK